MEAHVGRIFQSVTLTFLCWSACRDCNDEPELIDEIAEVIVCGEFGVRINGLRR